MKVSVIIPTLNESKTIQQIISLCQQQSFINEIIVVDDKSIDNTVQLAKKQGATVITSTKLGKGSSMKDGVLYANNDIVLFLDGDIEYATDAISLMCLPIINNEVDFIKSTFTRNAGRVTELVAKPLLSIFFPELLKFNQPLSGIIAGKKNIFETIDFQNGYGVDIGLLIDLHMKKISMKEVNIGHVENKSKPWQHLNTMSKEVSQTIITKALNNNLGNLNLKEFKILEEVKTQIEQLIQNSNKNFEKMVVFDMDKTLLQKSFIETFCRENNKYVELENIRKEKLSSFLQTKKIAQLLKNFNIADILKITDKIPFTSGVKQVVEEFKNKNYIIGIISDSYDCVVNHVKQALDLHFAIGNELEFSKSICTGEVKIPSFFLNDSHSMCKHEICKTNAILSLIENYKINLVNVIAIGDGENDICMIEKSGFGIAYGSNNNILNCSANVVLNKNEFEKIKFLIQ